MHDAEVYVESRWEIKRIEEGKEKMSRRGMKERIKFDGLRKKGRFHRLLPPKIMKEQRV